MITKGQKLNFCLCGVVAKRHKHRETQKGNDSCCPIFKLPFFIVGINILFVQGEISVLVVPFTSVPLFVFRLYILGMQCYCTLVRRDGLIRVSPWMTLGQIKLGSPPSKQSSP